MNGSSVQTTVVRKAVIAEKDVTAKLLALGLSDTQVFSQSKITQVVRDLTPRQKAVIEKLGGNLEQFPPWKVAVTMVWQQTFPAGKEIVVEHSYAPIVGAIYTVPLWEGNFSDSPWIPLPTETTDEACLNEMTRQSIEKEVRAHAKKNLDQVYVTLSSRRIYLGHGAELERSNRRVHTKNRKGNAGYRSYPFAFLANPRRLVRQSTNSIRGISCLKIDLLCTSTGWGHTSEILIILQVHFWTEASCRGLEDFP